MIILSVICCIGIICMYIGELGDNDQLLFI